MTDSSRSTLLTNARLIDCTGALPRDGVAVAVEGERITGIYDSGALEITGNVEWDQIIDCQGRTVMPGLIDAHVHIGTVQVNVLDQHRLQPANLIALKMGVRLEETLQQGFTTIRDAGGTDWSFKEAIEEGVISGPRLLVSNLWLSQTGGHGDRRTNVELHAPEFYRPSAGAGTMICDGVDEVRKATREMLRLEADQIKVMASGGAMSPSDELDAVQYTVGELRAAVEEAEAAGKYVMAHAYNDASIRNCLQAGVRSLEHGNLIGKETAELIADSESYLVPTLVTYEVLAEQGLASGVPQTNIDKINDARKYGLEALRYAYEAGAKIGSGSDLLGPMHVHKARELGLKARVMSSMEALVATTKTNSELFGLGDEIGTIETGKVADLLVVEGDPIEDIELLANADNLRIIMKEGAIYKDMIR